MHIENDRFIYLDGEISPGDAEHLASLSVEMKRPMVLYINSPGGDVLEAMRIAQLVKGLHVAVMPEKGGLCASSCFFVLLEGFQRVFGIANDDNKLPAPNIRANASGFVGIHRPFLKYSREDIASIKQQELMMKKVSAYLSSKSVPEYLIDEMMARPSNDIYWLNEHDSNMIGRFDSGVEEAMIAKCDYSRAINAMPTEISKKINTCIVNYWINQYIPLQNQFRAKLRAGWRPWNN